MTRRTKNILVLSGFVLSVLVIAFALYFFIFKPTPPPATVTDTVADIFTGTLPTSIQEQLDRELEEAIDDAGLIEADDVATGGLTKTIELTTGQVFNTNISADGQDMNFYNETDGRFYTINEDGEVVALSDQQFPDAENVEWNKDSEKVVVEFPDGSNIVYNFETKKQITLPSHWEDFDFSPVQDELIAKSIALDPNNRALVITDDDGSSARTIQALGENADKVDISWSPNDQVVAFAKTASSIQGGLDRNIIYPVGKNKENYKGLVVEGIGFDSLWSPNGKQLLYSVTGDYSNNKPLLWIVDATSSTMGDNRRSLGLNTWVDKCTWHSTKIFYCAVPLDMPINAGLGRGIYKGLADALYRVDLSSGFSNLIAIPEQETAMNNITVSDDESLLYFTNTLGQLELMRLK
jgi:hypothetical protein